MTSRIASVTGRQLWDSRGRPTVEAEVVFLIRSAGQWPLHQTEIHFHPSTQIHRDAAASVMAHYTRS